jgi:hypothetical protein
MKKVLVLVLSHTEWPYNMMEECIRDTWGKFKHPNVEIYYSHANGLEAIIEDDVIRAPYVENYSTIGYKTITAFEYFLTKDFDYVFRPNSSSFVNFPRLLNFLESTPSEKYYSGSPIPFNAGGVTELDKTTGPKFCCSGCGYILSRDLVELIVNDKEEWEHRIIDDLALCKFLNDRGVQMIESPRIKAHYTKDGEIYSFENKLTINEILNQFHITTRTSEIRQDIVNHREHNCEIIKALYNKVYES